MNFHYLCWGSLSLQFNQYLLKSVCLKQSTVIKDTPHNVNSSNPHFTQMCFQSCASWGSYQNLVSFLNNSPFIICLARDFLVILWDLSLLRRFNSREYVLRKVFGFWFFVFHQFGCILSLVSERLESHSALYRTIMNWNRISAPKKLAKRHIDKS